MFWNLLWMSCFVRKHFYSCFVSWRTLNEISLKTDSILYVVYWIWIIYTVFYAVANYQSSRFYSLWSILYSDHMPPSQAGGRNHENLLFLSQNNPVLRSVVALSYLWTVNMEKSGCKVKWIGYPTSSSRSCGFTPSPCNYILCGNKYPLPHPSLCFMCTKVVGYLLRTG